MGSNFHSKAKLPLSKSRSVAVFRDPSEKKMPTSRGGGQVKGGVALGSDAPLGDGRRRLSRNAYVADFLRITSPVKPRPSNFLIFFTDAAQIELHNKIIRCAMALRRDRQGSSGRNWEARWPCGRQADLAAE